MAEIRIKFIEDNEWDISLAACIRIASEEFLLESEPFTDGDMNSDVELVKFVDDVELFCEVLRNRADRENLGFDIDGDVLNTINEMKAEVELELESRC